MHHDSEILRNFESLKLFIVMTGAGGGRFSPVLRHAPAMSLPIYILQRPRAEHSVYT